MTNPQRNKKNWVLLRGLSRGRGHWGVFKDILAEKFPEDHFEYIDLPGNGERHELTSPLNVSEYVEDLRLQCSFLQKGESFQIVALSFGGMIATEWMVRYPDEVTKAYLVCTSSSKHSRPYERLRLQNFLKGVALFMSTDQAKNHEEITLSLVANNAERIAEELLGFTEYTRKNPVQNRNRLRQIFAASKYKFPDKVPGDIVLFGSYGDKLVSPDCTLKLAQAWGLDAQMHPTAGHDIAIDDPRWLTERLL